MRYNGFNYKPNKDNNNVNTTPVSTKKNNNTQQVLSMLYVINENKSKVVNVYDITYDSNGYPLFLIYFDNRWVRISAKHFKPLN